MTMTKTTNYMLWSVQALLALLFLFTGGMKLALPIEAMTKQIALPRLFPRFIGVAEVLGAIALILPGTLRIRQGLTPLAAAALVVVMIGAIAVSWANFGIAQALMPLVVGILLAWVAYRRWAWTASARIGSEA
jgi:uncharacterized membrane protein YphA (DoxX/SURF4 family)